ncbi:MULTISPECIES: fimbrial protein [Providencia]|nr:MULTISPECIES: fimbrial protein [Providencia]ELH9584746.1 type 1 fimbrial protein [Providencia rettgeri]ELM3938097.1 type 1 fimbrial protein [Providencia rettgeri]ELR5288861.1 type 1 fimbrial protein [Providencia rettgeri]EMA4645762.1 type 1 fimbrial protein [Providencia rettgeri]EMC8780153.1 type 1 fimbrial protein [Providencia rettgeri]
MIKRLTLVLFAIFSTNVMANKQGHGSVTLNGQIIESACSILTDDIYQDIDFGAISINYLSGKSLSPIKDFSIHLVNCDLNKESGEKWIDASITFSGLLDMNVENTFLTTGSAEGVGIKIYDNEFNVAKDKEAMPAIELQDKNTTLYYKIQLVRNNKPLKAGNYKSFIRYMVSYH